MDRTRTKHRVGLFLLVLGIATIPWGGPSQAQQREWRPAAARLQAIEAAGQFLSSLDSLAEISHFLGSLPENCEVVSDISRVCIWRLSKAQPAWFPLAKALDTGDRLNLICGLVEEEGTKEKPSCSVHPQRSNRDYFKDVRRKARRKRTDEIHKAERRGKGVKRTYQTAHKAYVEFLLQHEKLSELFMSHARSGIEMSTVVGDIPESCFEIGGEYRCVWKTHAGTEGHGTLACSMGAYAETSIFSDRIRLTCRFPSDGSPRSTGSCKAEVGD